MSEEQTNDGPRFASLIDQMQDWLAKRVAENAAQAKVEVKS